MWDNIQWTDERPLCRDGERLSQRKSSAIIHIHHTPLTGGSPKTRTQTLIQDSSEDVAGPMVPHLLLQADRVGVAASSKRGADLREATRPVEKTSTSKLDVFGGQRLGHPAQEPKKSEQPSNTYRSRSGVTTPRTRSSHRTTSSTLFCRTKSTELQDCKHLCPRSLPAKRRRESVHTEGNTDAKEQNVVREMRLQRCQAAYTASHKDSAKLLEIDTKTNILDRAIGRTSHQSDPSIGASSSETGPGKLNLGIPRSK